jgi:deazaflavin-dependent oxidoreductase (nitroreductase family)
MSGDRGASAPLATDAFNNEVVEEYRATGGRVSGPLDGTPLILIHHIGARSGIERVTPLACTPYGDGRYVIVASNGGSPTHPSWYYNLRANPRIDVELGTQRLTMVAEEVHGTARADQWPKLLAMSPSLRRFDAATRRQIPLFVLAREDRRDPSGSDARERRLRRTTGGSSDRWRVGLPASGPDSRWAKAATPPGRTVTVR